jgi:tetratricopeptide (TPR) repeat protein
MHNIGNLETASGNLQDAMKYLEKAQLIAANSNSNSTLAKIYLGISRIHYLHYQFEPARKWLIQAELLVTRSTGADKGFMDL